MLLRLCRCGKASPNRPAICDECKAREPERKQETNRYYDTRLRDPQADAFYHSAAWKKSRAAYLQSVGYICEDCIEEFKRGERKEDDIRPATDVHHEEPIAVNWSRRLDPSNYRALCDWHHKQKRIKTTPGGPQNSTRLSVATPQQPCGVEKSPR